MAGNAFHTAVDCLFKTGQTDDNYTFGKDAIKYFDGIITDQNNPTKWRQEYGYWVDDYGWWGIAFITAYFYADKLGYDAALKQKLGLNAKNCWEALHACWDNNPIQWNNSQGQQITITGGIPNTTEFVSMAGRNSVTNECFWRLSVLLANAFGDYYLDPNTNSTKFFAQAKDQNILFDSNELVLQRFLGLPPFPTPNWSWLGDQGLFLICSYFNREAGPGDFNQTQAAATAKAVRTSRIHCTRHNPACLAPPQPPKLFELQGYCRTESSMKT